MKVLSSDDAVSMISNPILHRWSKMKRHFAAIRTFNLQKRMNESVRYGSSSFPLPVRLSMHLNCSYAEALRQLNRLSDVMPEPHFYRKIMTDDNNQTIDPDPVRREWNLPYYIDRIKNIKNCRITIQCLRLNTIPTTTTTTTTLLTSGVDRKGFDQWTQEVVMSVIGSEPTTFFEEEHSINVDYINDINDRIEAEYDRNFGVHKHLQRHLDELSELSDIYIHRIFQNVLWNSPPKDDRKQFISRYEINDDNNSTDSITLLPSHSTTTTYTSDRVVITKYYSTSSSLEYKIGYFVGSYEESMNVEPDTTGMLLYDSGIQT